MAVAAEHPPADAATLAFDRVRRLLPLLLLRAVAFVVNAFVAVEKNNTVLDHNENIKKGGKEKKGKK